MHLEDKFLVQDGSLLLKDLFTIRIGEPVMENVLNRRTVAETDLIKIKGSGQTWMCRFFDEPLKACRIYSHRPVECRVLNCRAPQELEALYQKDRLQRRDLLEKLPEWISLMDEHDHRCGYPEVTRLIERIQVDPDPDTLSQILEIVLYDTHIRELVVQMRRIDPEILDFLLGTPLWITVKRMGVGIERKREGGYRIYPLKQKPF